MGHSQLTLQVVYHNRLTVAQIVAPGGSVADMTHRKAALGQLFQLFLIKNLTDQTQTLVGGEHAVIVDRDAAALLAPVLKGIETVVHKSCHIRLVWAIDAEYAAFLVDAHKPCSRLAFTKPRNRGWGLLGRLLNSGWY